MNADARAARIVDAITAARIRLRFDKVVVRLVTELQATVGPLLAKEHAVVFTVTAPIKLPAKTCTVLQERLPAVDETGWCGDVHGNIVHARRVRRSDASDPHVLGFVHNHAHDAERILAIAARTLEGSGQPPVEE